MSDRRVLASACVTISALFAVAPVAARELVVPTAEYATIQRALDSAHEGDTVVVEPGDYHLTASLDFNRLHDPGDPGTPRLKNVTLRARGGAVQTVLRWDPASPGTTAPLLVVAKGESPATTLEGFTLRGFPAGRSAAIRIEDSSLTIRGCVVRAAGGDGALEAAGASVVIEDSTFVANRDGALLLEGSDAVIVRSTFTENGDGAVLLEGSDVEIVGSTFAENRTGASGGAIRAQGGGSVVVRDCAFVANTATYGGAIAASQARLELSGSTLRENVAEQQGGAFYLENGVVAEITDAEIVENIASAADGAGGGGCITLGASVNVARSVIASNRAASGGGLCVSGELTIAASALRRNAANVDGGGLFVALGDVSGERVTFFANAAVRGGALAVAAGRASWERVTVTHNSAWGGGAALEAWHDARVEIASSIIWENGDHPFAIEPPATLAVTFSDVDAGARDLAGEGNIRADPRFCAFDGGDVTLSPGELLDESFTFRTALVADSPCLGAGRDGVDMGAAAEVCESPGSRARTIWLEPGDHVVERIEVSTGIALSARVPEETTLAGLVRLEGVSRLADIRLRGGIEASAGSRAVIERCHVTAEGGVALDLAPGSDTLAVATTFTGAVADELDLAAVECREGSRARFEGCDFVANLGAGIRLQNAVAELHDCRLAENADSACVVAGPLAHALLDGCVLERNTAVRRTASGAGVLARNRGRVVLSGCRITSNAAVRSAAVALLGADATLTSCLVTGNLDRTGGTIGAQSAGTGDVNDPFDRSLPANLTMINCTVAGNGSHDQGAPIQAEGTGETLVRNTIIWGNEPRNAAILRCPGTVEFSAFDGEVFAEDEARFAAVTATNLRVDPRFVRPGVYDFSAADADPLLRSAVPDFVVERGDYRLASGSPARDAGTFDGAPPADHDRRARPCGGGVDMGAFEAGDCVFARFLRGDADGDGRRTLTDALAIAGGIVGDRTLPCRDAADADDDGALNLTDALYLLNHLFLEGPDLPSPASTCGADATVDGLECDDQSAC